MCCRVYLVPIRERYPNIAIETVPSDSAENLLLREADIAIRMFRPTQLELVTKHLGDLDIVPAAHQRYLDRRGMPKVSVDDLFGHDLIGLDRSDLIIAHARKAGSARCGASISPFAPMTRPNCGS